MADTVPGSFRGAGGAAAPVRSVAGAAPVGAGQAGGGGDTALPDMRVTHPVETVGTDGAVLVVRLHGYFFFNCSHA